MLRLDPDPLQVELMERMARARGPYDHLGTDETTLRAACMVVLWRVLRVPGSRATVIAPSRADSLAAGELGTAAMGFLAEVCKTRDAVLSSIVKVPSIYRLQVGDEPGWELRFCHNLPPAVAESAARSLTGLVIGAGDAETALGEAARELDRIVHDPRGLLIRLW